MKLGKSFNSRPMQIPPAGRPTLDMDRWRKSLPVYRKREEILHTIAANPVCIIQGDTGCGKTTQDLQLYSGRGDYHERPQLPQSFQAVTQDTKYDPTILFFVCPFCETKCYSNLALRIDSGEHRLDEMTSLEKEINTLVQHTTRRSFGKRDRRTKISSACKTTCALGSSHEDSSWDTPRPFRKPQKTSPTGGPQTPEEVKKWFKNQLRPPVVGENIKEPVHKLSSKLSLVADKRNGTVEKNDRPLQLILKETETVWLMTIISGYSDLDVEDLTSGIKDKEETKVVSLRETSRKRLNAETQTPKNSEKCKGCETADIKTVSSFVNASAWDLYDTYAQVGGEEGFGIKEFQLLIDTALKSRGVLHAQPGTCSELTKLPADKQIKLLVKNDRFQYCVLAIERLLASKTFQEKQTMLKKKTRDRYDTVPPSLFSYQINMLWTFDNHFVEPLSVTAFDWNPQNSLLLAVGYGRLNFEDDEAGCVCVWSPKNPSHPERKFWMQFSVTTLCFSSERPNILAVGTRAGHVVLIDIACTEGTIRFLPRGELPPLFGPVWKVEWFVRHTAVGVEEELMVLGESGVLTCFSLCDSNSSSDILKLDYTIAMSCGPVEDGNEKKEFSSKALGGLSFSLVPEQHVCYIGSKEGVVVKCTIRSPCSADVRISAHMGPVYVIQHSPATPKIFLTCGADHFLKIWVDGISEPLLTLVSAMPTLNKTMVCAQWSPNLPTVIATLTSTELAIWDISRKCSEPVNNLRLRSTDPPFSTLKFTPDGIGLIAGDHQGHVKVYQLSELPRPPFLVIEALTSALVTCLGCKPEMLLKFKKLLHFSKDEFKTKVT